MIKRIMLAIAVISILGTSTAEAKIWSRDFGSDDAERLAKLATAELPDGTVTDKADLMLEVLDYAWANGCSIPAAITHYPSAIQGTYIETVPDEESLLAVELIYNGWERRGTDGTLAMVTRLVRILEWALPLLCILFLMLLMALISICLEELQERIGERRRK